MSVLFPVPEQQDPATEALLRGAVETTCYSLVRNHNVETLKLNLLIETISAAILERFRAGERDEELMARHAISCALERMRRRVN